MKLAAISALLLAVSTFSFPTDSRADSVTPGDSHSLSTPDQEAGIAGNFPGLPSEADPSAARVDFLGGARVTFFSRGYMRIPVQSCARDREVVHSIRLRVLGNTVRINDLVVTYGNGQQERLQVRQIFRPGTTSRWIRLANFRRGRCLRNVLVNGQSVLFPPRPATIQIYGLVDRAN